MNINDLKTKTPYRITQSPYQFLVGDVVYLQNDNTLVLQGDGAFHISTLFAVSGKDGGALSLNEVVHPCEFSDDGILDGLPEEFDTETNMREFLLKYDKTEFEVIANMVCQVTDYTSKVIKKLA